MTTPSRPTDTPTGGAKAKRQARRQATIDRYLETTEPAEVLAALKKARPDDFTETHRGIDAYVIHHPGGRGPARFYVAVNTGIIDNMHIGRGLTPEQVIAAEASYYDADHADFMDPADIAIFEGNNVIAVMRKIDDGQGSHKIIRLDHPGAWRGIPIVKPGDPPAAAEPPEAKEPFASAIEQIRRDAREDAALGADADESRPAVTTEQARTELAAAIRIARAPEPTAEDPTRPAPRAPRHFDNPRISKLGYPFLRDVADVLLTSNGTKKAAEELMPKLEGADLAVVDAIRDAAGSVSAFAEQALARIIVLLWQRDHEFREPFRGSGAPWKSCGAVLDQFVVWAAPGTYDGGPVYDTENGEVTIAHLEDFGSDEAEAAFMAKAPRRMVKLRSDRATVVTPDELAEAALV